MTLRSGDRASWRASY